MKTLHFIFATLTLLLTLCFNAKADPGLDARLDVYVKMFKLKPLEEPEKVNAQLFRLGRELFFEKDISGNKNISCADCHHPIVGSHDGLPLALGEGAVGLETKPGGRSQADGKLLARNSPALFNLGSLPFMFWDGRVHLNPETGVFTTPAPLPADFVRVLDSALAAQALFPMVDHDEMRGQKGTNEIADATTTQEAWDAIFARLKRKGYHRKLAAVYPKEEINLAHVAKAIAYFERQAFWAGDTAFDRFLKGDKTAMTEVQKIGMDVFFGKGKCGECHQGQDLTDNDFHNIGIPQFGPGKENGDDFGRGDYAFRTPPLRNSALTAPYMHDGAFKTLAQVIEHYDDIATDLEEYQFVNNYKNYAETIGGVLKDTNAEKLSKLSSKLHRQLFFEESEEKALAEFLRGALTDLRFVNAEIDQDYVTALRIQLTEEGWKKLKANLPADARPRHASYYYYDVLTSEGYGLRELEKPIKIFFTEADGKTILSYRKQLFKTSGSAGGVIAGGTFEDEELLELSEHETKTIAALNRDFYQRLYTYKDAPIPQAEKDVMKNDVLGMNALWHQLKLEHFVTMSDELNMPFEEILFAPTSMNEKDEDLWVSTIEGFEVQHVLQHSYLWNERGGREETWAIELKLPKVRKKQLPQLLGTWLKTLVDQGLVKEDAQGTTPSPSKLTEKVLLEMF